MFSRPKPRTPEVRKSINTFNDVLAYLINLLKVRAAAKKDKVREAHAGRLEKRLNLLLSADSEAVLKLAYLKVINFREQIEKRDENFFRQYVESGQMKEALTNPVEGIDDVINTVKTEYEACTQAEKDAIYSKMDELLQCSLSYHKFLTQ